MTLMTLMSSLAKPGLVVGRKKQGEASDPRTELSCILRARAKWSGNSRPLSSRVHHISFLQSTAGNQIVPTLIKPTIVQTRLKIRQLGDFFEQEADRVAELAIHMTDSQVPRQPKEKKKKTLRVTKIYGKASEIFLELESLIRGLRSDGHPLPMSVRAFFEPRFGYDFNQVQIHTDLEADILNRALNANAFTIGKDIFFREGAYSPATSKGRKLLGHELTHVVQQSSINEHNIVQYKLIVGDREYQYKHYARAHAPAIGETGRKYLKSIIESANKHVYENWEMLGHDLIAKDKLKEAALETNRNIKFAQLKQKPRYILDDRYWVPIEDDKFEFSETGKPLGMKLKRTPEATVRGKMRAARTHDYAKGFNAIFSDREKNRLECKNLSQVMALRALHLSLGDERFNTELKRVLGEERLTIQLNDKLLAQEDIAASPERAYSYTGEKVFRPGDIVAFSATELEASIGTLWQVENAVVVGWNDKGELLFVGGGLGGMEENVYTEKEMKKEICRQIAIAKDARPTYEELNACVDAIELHTSVERVQLLGKIVYQD